VVVVVVVVAMSVGSAAVVGDGSRPEVVSTSDPLASRGENSLSHLPQWHDVMTSCPHRAQSCVLEFMSMETG